MDNVRHFQFIKLKSVRFADKLKLGLKVEAMAWKKSLGVILSKRYKEKLHAIIDYINEKNIVLSRTIKDLEDVRIAMKCLGEIRDDFIPLDMELILIEETYTLMGRFDVDILKEDQDLVDGLRYNFTSMLNMVDIFVIFIYFSFYSIFLDTFR